MKPLAKAGLITTLVGSSVGLLMLFIYWIVYFVWLAGPNVSFYYEWHWILFLIFPTAISIVVLVLSAYTLAKKPTDNNLKIALGVLGCISFWNVITLVGSILVLCALDNKNDVQSTNVQIPKVTDF